MFCVTWTIIKYSTQFYWLFIFVKCRRIKRNTKYRSLYSHSISQFPVFIWLVCWSCNNSIFFFIRSMNFSSQFFFSHTFLQLILYPTNGEYKNVFSSLFRALEHTIAIQKIEHYHSWKCVWLFSMFSFDWKNSHVSVIDNEYFVSTCHCHHSLCSAVHPLISSMVCFFSLVLRVCLCLCFSSCLLFLIRLFVKSVDMYLCIAYQFVDLIGDFQFQWSAIAGSMFQSIFVLFLMQCGKRFFSRIHINQLCSDVEKIVCAMESSITVHLLRWFLLNISRLFYYQ